VPIIVSNNSQNISQSIERAWDKAIKDAEEEIERLRMHSLRLRHAVQIFKKNKQDGVQWPGEGKNDAVTR